jgi:hypothetical protein
VRENAKVYGNAQVSGITQIYAYACVGGNARIDDFHDYLFCGPIDSTCKYVTFYKDCDGIGVGYDDLTYTLESFQIAILETHKDERYGVVCNLAIDRVKAWITMGPASQEA